MSRRVVITSFGVVSSLGTTTDEILENIQAGNTNFQFSSTIENTPICPIEKFDLNDWVGRHKNKRYLIRGSAFAVGAAVEACRQANINSDQLTNAGLFVGAGPHLDITSEFPNIEDGEIHWKSMPALWMLKFVPNTAASMISQLLGIHGESSTLGTACTASLQAIGEAFRKVRDGYLDLALAGGGDSRLSSAGLMAYKKAGALSKESKDPTAAIRPFDASSTGFVPGEGGAFFLLESLEHAQQRKARILGEICGCGNATDGYAMTAPNPEGRWTQSAVIGALKDAGLSYEDIDLISSHGTGTPLNDAMEAKLIHHLFGNYRPAVMALKSWIGHLSAACGAVELALCLILAHAGYLPGIRNLKNPCHPSVQFVQAPRACSLQTLLIENFGFGGQNSALVVRLWKE